VVLARFHDSHGAVVQQRLGIGVPACPERDCTGIDLKLIWLIGMPTASTGMFLQTAASGLCAIDTGAGQKHAEHVNSARPAWRQSRP